MKDDLESTNRILEQIMDYLSNVNDGKNLSMAKYYISNAVDEVSYKIDELNKIEESQSISDENTNPIID